MKRGWQPVSPSTAYRLRPDLGRFISDPVLISHEGPQARNRPDTEQDARSGCSTLMGPGPEPTPTRRVAVSRRQVLTPSTGPTPVTRSWTRPPAGSGRSRPHPTPSCMGKALARRPGAPRSSSSPPAAPTSAHGSSSTPHSCRAGGEASPRGPACVAPRPGRRAPWRSCAWTGVSRSPLVKGVVRRADEKEA